MFGTKKEKTVKIPLREYLRLIENSRKLKLFEQQREIDIKVALDNLSIELDT